MDPSDTLTPFDLFRTQLELECKGFDPSGDVVQIPGDNPDGINRFHIMKHADGYFRYFRHDVPQSLRTQLNCFSDEQALKKIAHIRALISDQMGPAEMWAGKTYTFEQIPQPDQFPAAKQDGACWIIEVDGERASWAQSARQNQRAAELGVETLPRFRHRGFARQVAAAWAYQMHQEKRIAFYSHTLDNYASQHLARSLGVKEQFTFVGC